MCISILLTLFEPHSVQLGSQNTGHDLHSQIYRHVSAKHRIILSGRELKLAEEPTKFLKDFGIQDKCVVTIYVQEAIPPSGTARHTIGQPQIERHFEALYPLLGLPESLAIMTWTFLKKFSPDESVKRRLKDPEASALEIFPPDKPHKTLYSLFALRHCFEGLEFQAVCPKSHKSDRHKGNTRLP
ncbi:hypothetical protein FN846DRAFT_548593 [Sphaerosporella brunnea]|uniref:Ubiquitin-like domain-containing protein n=1 Tax=Sphaerosporella brunnea TaxID=1250544 RepID=A0A5J5ED40_9PEZI|nr:hypothetical protein FN846DRAFT_548593 [Sphaerosporella brunnea]